MVSTNTQEAIKAFVSLLEAEQELKHAKKCFSDHELLVPEIEKEAYFKELETQRKRYEGIEEYRNV